MTDGGVVIIEHDGDLLPQLTIQEVDHGGGRGVRRLEPVPAGNIWPRLATRFGHVGKGQHGPVFEFMHDIGDPIMVEPAHEAGGQVQLHHVPAPDLPVEILSQDDLWCLFVPAGDDVHLLFHANIPGASERFDIQELKVRVSHRNMPGRLIGTTGIDMDGILCGAESQAANKDIGQALARPDDVDGIRRAPFAVKTIAPESCDAGDAHI
jgi:hypothetical protein